VAGSSRRRGRGACEFACRGWGKAANSIAEILIKVPAQDDMGAFGFPLSISLERSVIKTSGGQCWSPQKVPFSLRNAWWSYCFADIVVADPRAVGQFYLLGFLAV
jgi:hypothetical protein